MENLTALLIEVLDRHDRNFVIANSKKNARKPKPLKVPRPGKPKKKRNATGDELAALVGKLGGAVVGPKYRDTYRDARGRLHDRATGRYVKEG
jgi:hypothetical protein